MTVKVQLVTEILTQEKNQDSRIDTMWKLLSPTLSQNVRLSDEFWWQTAIDSPDRILGRFLISHEFDILAAVKSIIEFLEWRCDFKVKELVYNGEFNDSISRHIFISGKGIFWGYDKEGYLLIYLYPARHNLFAQKLEETKRHIVYQTELGRRLVNRSSEKATDKVTVIIDLKGMHTSSLDIMCAKFVLFCLQKNYPDTLNRILIINSSVFYGIILQAVSTIIKPEVRKKLHHLSDPKQLLDFVDKKFLLKEYGGESKYKYEYIPPIPPQVSEKNIQEAIQLEEEARDIIKAYYKSMDKDLLPNIKAIYEKIDGILYPGDFYSRISVSRNGVVDWSDH